MRKDYASSAGIILSAGDRSATCSCRLERDPGHLSYNRIVLVGDRDAWRGVLPLQSARKVEWRLHENEGWYSAQGSRQRTFTSGTAFIRSIGMSQGVAVHPTGVQDFGDLDILEFVETSQFGKDDETHKSMEFTFLQRPLDWSPWKRRFSFRTGLTRRGDWFKVGPTRFRSVLHGELRNDPRLSKEVELIELPGFEVEPIGGGDPDGFPEAAEKLWFCLRILVSFRHRQLLHPLRTLAVREDQIAVTWRPQAVEPRQKKQDYRDGPITGSPDSFLASGARRLLALPEHQEALHAAVYGYASSYTMTLVEGRLTACVEALERLIGVHEQINGLGRELVDPIIWKAASKTLRKAVDGLGLTPIQAQAVRQNLAGPLNMPLEARLQRMIQRYQRRWSSKEMGVAKLKTMIQLRNHIVHGRMITDYGALQAEILRAQTLFELLFLNMLGCHTFFGSGHARWMLDAHDAQDPS